MNACRVLLLDLAVDPALYQPADHWRALLGTVPSQRVNLVSGQDLPPTPDQYSHLIVTGSETTVIEPQPWFAKAEQVIRQATAAGRPVLGSCFGHQLIVRALSGPRYVRRSATPELGWIPIETLNDSAALGAATRRIWMFCCHFDEVCDLPGEYEILARSAACAVQAYRLTSAPVWGIQAHPEIDPTTGVALLNGFARQRPDIRPLVDRALATPPRDDGFARELVARFLEAS